MSGLSINDTILEIKPRLKIICHGSLVDFWERQALKVKANEPREMDVPIILGLFCSGHGADHHDGLVLAAVNFIRRLG